MKSRLLISALAPLTSTGLAILLQVIFPRLHASGALWIAGACVTFVAISANTSNSNSNSNKP